MTNRKRALTIDLSFLSGYYLLPIFLKKIQQFYVMYAIAYTLNYNMLTADQTRIMFSVSGVSQLGSVDLVILLC